MAVVAAVALAGDVSVAVLAVGLVLVCSAAIWFALTRRGPRRAAGAALAALSGSGLIVVLVANWRGVVVLVALLLLLAMFGLAARYALGRTGETTVSGRGWGGRAGGRRRIGGADHQPEVGWG
jgi:hypothetical protein